MAELNLQVLHDADYWNEQYSATDAPQKIEARKLWYTCDEPGVPFFGLEDEVVRSMHHAGITSSDTIVDVGSSYPQFLINLRKGGHTGRLIAVEPNAMQFGDVPYWEPKSPEEIAIDTVTGAGIFDTFGQLYKMREGTPDLVLESIELIEESAEFLPIEDKEADVATFNLSAYHIQDIEAAMSEALRAAGMVTLTTRGQHNKAKMLSIEKWIAEALTGVTGKLFTPPLLTNAGLTTERAREVLPKHEERPFVYEKTVSGKVVFDDEQRLDVMIGSLWTRHDLYRTRDGEMPTVEAFDAAVASALFLSVMGVLKYKRPIRDKKIESVFLLSNHPLDVMEGYEERTLAKSSAAG
jgi:hypothetical protein